MNTIGTCGNCGGRVTMPNMMVNPVARCEDCGATPINPHGPTIPMQPGSGNGTWQGRKNYLENPQLGDLK